MVSVSGLSQGWDSSAVGCTRLQKSLGASRDSLAALAAGLDLALLCTPKGVAGEGEDNSSDSEEEWFDARSEETVVVYVRRRAPTCQNGSSARAEGDLASFDGPEAPTLASLRRVMRGRRARGDLTALEHALLHTVLTLMQDQRSLHIVVSQGGSGLEEVMGRLKGHCIQLTRTCAKIVEKVDLLLKVCRRARAADAASVPCCGPPAMTTIRIRRI